VSENRVLRRIFGPRWEEVTGNWRNLHNEELCNLDLSPNIIRMIKSRRMRWAGHVARMGWKRNAYVLVLKNLWLFLFAAQLKSFFLDGLKKLEQGSLKCVEVRGEYVE
jgi:hypothetical protein